MVDESTYICPGSFAACCEVRAAWQLVMLVSACLSLHVLRLKVRDNSKLMLSLCLQLLHPGDRHQHHKATLHMFSCLNAVCRIQNSPHILVE